ncbi:MAG: hypothetical protein CYPHOPRED_002519 [Cyphobasidiales sp. Tagirdzhanova-0007]|nr:MAG: hypothetical protein CYPHOPRED_002519 [Cyphobasidiales sp. Tagirdzhanova-0007]
MASLSTHSKAVDCSSASREELLARISELERMNEASTSTHDPYSTHGKRGKAFRKEKKQTKLVDGKGRRPDSDFSADAQNEFFDRYPSRKIALRFCYEGWLYGGLALQDEGTPLPTVEGVLLDALTKARLIKEGKDLAEIEFSRCGRTDRGVSAAGQVVSLYVRSQLSELDGVLEQGWRPAKAPLNEEYQVATPQALQERVQSLSKQKQKQASKYGAKEELPYQLLLNRVLPPSIRILAWSPVSPDFDSRFSCRFRHYKYFFSSSSSSSSIPSSLYSSALDIEAMRDGASRLVGEHDFRNFCKIDPTKQMTHFRRSIMSATIDQLPCAPDEEELLYVLNLSGSAFLYHQVRHIMAVLFLVGSGVEPPTIIDNLLNTGYWDDLLDPEKARPHPNMPVIASRPSYEMADGLPLMLWECVFPESAVHWRQDRLRSISGHDKGALDMGSRWTQHRLASVISQHFLESCLSFVPPPLASIAPPSQEYHLIQVGAGRTLNIGTYKPLLGRSRSDLVEVINQRWLEGQGQRRVERKSKALGEATDDTDRMDEGEPAESMKV